VQNVWVYTQVRIWWQF